MQKDTIAQLEKLALLLESNAISSEEFSMLKAKILRSELPSSSNFKIEVFVSLCLLEFLKLSFNQKEIESGTIAALDKFDTLSKSRKEFAIKALLPILGLKYETYLSSKSKIANFDKGTTEEIVGVFSMLLIISILQLFDKDIFVDNKGFFKTGLVFNKYLSDFEIFKFIERYNENTSTVPEIELWKNTINDISTAELEDMQKAIQVMVVKKKSYTSDEKLNEDYLDIVVENWIEDLEDAQQKRDPELINILINLIGEDKINNEFKIKSIDDDLSDIFQYMREDKEQRFIWAISNKLYLHVFGDN